MWEFCIGAVLLVVFISIVLGGDPAAKLLARARYYRYLDKENEDALS